MGRLADRFGIVAPVAARRARARRSATSRAGFAPSLWQFALRHGC